MKELRRNMKLVGVLLVMLFVGLAVWFAMTAYTQGSIWASDVHNTRLAVSNTLRGDITDRDGNLLATTGADGRRQYTDNEQARRALSQTVGDTAGMSGVSVETLHASTLMNISTSLLDRVNELFSGAEHIGSSIQITVDGRLQAYIASQFPSGYRGAVCVTNYRTGEILSMVSMPNYDPYALNGEVEDTAFLNRCLQGLYTPGSVFKIVTLASALMNDPSVLDQKFTCKGKWEHGDVRIVCAGNTAHGDDLNLSTAFKRSCNVVFGKLAYELGLDRLRATAEQFGFNENFKFGDFVVYNSSFPENVDNLSGLVWAGVGQGEVLVTPLHMTLITATVANKGVMMKPMLVKKVTNAMGVALSTGHSTAYRRILSESVALKIAEFMYETVQDGTATNARVRGYTVCGKTGSAEVSDDKSVETNAWFTGFVYDDAHPYAISVVIEGGGAGAGLSSALAAKSLKAAIDMVG